MMFGIVLYKVLYDWVQAPSVVWMWVRDSVCPQCVRGWDVPGRTGGRDTPVTTQTTTWEETSQHSTATLRAEIEVDNTCSTIMIDKIVSVCIRVISTLLRQKNKYVSILKIAERLGNCVCKYNSNFTLFWFPDRKVTSVQIVESFRFLSFIFWSRTSENKM